METNTNKEAESKEQMDSRKNNKPEQLKVFRILDNSGEFADVIAIDDKAAEFICFKQGWLLIGERDEEQ